MKFILNCFTCIFYICLTTLPLQAQTTPNVWDVLRAQLSLDHEVSQPAVQEQLHWLIAHPSYLNKLARSEPYIYHIVNEVKKRHLPGELALLPMLESAYDPFAYSGVGAAGLWQLMPGTGSNLGLKQDWWYDARRSIAPSTTAALNYLNYLHRYFNGNWVLAIAAYDSGEGTIARAIKNSNQRGRVNFWTLPVPTETRCYVPRLLALAEIIKYPEHYHINLPEIPHVPYFEEVNIGSQIDLSHAARLAGMSYTELIKLNPGYNRWATAPYQPFKLNIPTTKVATFNRNLALVPQDKRVSWTRLQVQPGDNLNSIAQRYFTTAKLIRELNQLPHDHLRVGQYLLIPSTRNAPKAEGRTAQVLADKPITTQTYKVLHIVQAGETLQSIAQKYKLAVVDICRWNNAKLTQQLSKGKQLVIWRQAINPGIYTVKLGDSLGLIAQRNHTSVRNLQKLNPQLTQTIKPGQKIFIG